MMMLTMKEICVEDDDIDVVSSLSSSSSVSSHGNPPPIRAQQQRQAVASTRNTETARCTKDPTLLPPPQPTMGSVEVVMIDMESLHRILRVEKKREAKRRIERHRRWKRIDGDESLDQISVLKLASNSVGEGEGYDKDPCIGMNIIEQGTNRKPAGLCSNPTDTTAASSSSSEDDAFLHEKQITVNPLLEKETLSPNPRIPQQQQLLSTLNHRHQDDASFFTLEWKPWETAQELSDYQPGKIISLATKSTTCSVLCNTYTSDSAWTLDNSNHHFLSVSHDHELIGDVPFDEDDEKIQVSTQSSTSIHQRLNVQDDDRKDDTDAGDDYDDDDDDDATAAAAAAAQLLQEPTAELLVTESSLLHAFPHSLDEVLENAHSFEFLPTCMDWNMTDTKSDEVTHIWDPFLNVSKDTMDTFTWKDEYEDEMGLDSCNHDQMDIPWAGTGMDRYGFPLSSCHNITTTLPFTHNTITVVKPNKPLKKFYTPTMDKPKVSSIRAKKKPSTPSIIITPIPEKLTNHPHSASHHMQAPVHTEPIPYMNVLDDEVDDHHRKAPCTKTLRNPAAEMESSKRSSSSSKNQNPWSAVHLLLSKASFVDKPIKAKVTKTDSLPLLLETDLVSFSQELSTTQKDSRLKYSLKRFLFHKNGTEVSIEKLYQGRTIQGSSLSSFRSSSTSNNYSLFNSSAQASSDLVVASTLDDTGRCMYHKKEYSKAVTMFEEALRIKVRVYDLNDYVDLAMSLNSMGCTRIGLGSPVKALPVLMESIRMLREIVNRLDCLDPDLLRYQAMTLRNIGHTLFKLKRFDEAASYYQEACTLFKMIVGIHPEWCLETLDSCVLAKRAALRDPDALDVSIIPIEQFIMWSM